VLERAGRKSDFAIRSVYLILDLENLAPVQVAKYFGLEDSELPAIAIHDAKNDGKYFLKNAKPGAVNKWIDDFEVRPFPNRLMV
jgi:hypothetical protein